MPYGHVIQEDERFRALGEDVIHTHCHGVYAYGVVLVHRKGYLEFGSDAVGTAYQYRFLDSEGGEVEHSSE